MLKKWFVNLFKDKEAEKAKELNLARRFGELYTAIDIALDKIRYLEQKTGINFCLEGHEMEVTAYESSKSNPEAKKKRKSTTKGKKK
jgi:hypothetical protein